MAARVSEDAALMRQFAIPFSSTVERDRGLSRTEASSDFLVFRSCCSGCVPSCIRRVHWQPLLDSYSIRTLTCSRGFLGRLTLETFCRDFQKSHKDESARNLFVRPSDHPSRVGHVPR